MNKLRYQIHFLIVALALCLAAGLRGQDARQKAPPDDILTWKGKTVMLFSPHEDDELPCAGTLAKLIKNGNTVYVVVYSNGNKGSLDPEMTSERLAAIRKQEDLDANKVIGIPADHVIYLGYDDGMLEYVPQKEIVEKVCRLIRTYRPDALFTMDPGQNFVKWHKPDHRASALLTTDGARIAGYPLYYPSQIIFDGLKPFAVGDWFFYSTRETNYKVDITDAADIKYEATCKYASQMGSGNDKYTGPEMAPKDREKMKARVMRKGEDGKIYESFRRLTSDNW